MYNGHFLEVPRVAVVHRFDFTFILKQIASKLASAQMGFTSLDNKQPMNLNALTIANQVFFRDWRERERGREK